MGGNVRLFVALAIVLVALLSAPGVPSVAGGHASLPVGPRSIPAPFPRLTTRQPNGPASSNEWYTEVGATLSEENGSTLAGQLSDLVEDVTLVTSPYPIAYELNGLSTTGDWYQVFVGYDWAGCSSGFEMAYAVWDSAGGSTAASCDANLTLNSGDGVKMSLSLPSSTTACLDETDLTTTAQAHECMAQPDTGASGFELLGSAANANGYFSGPMTEVVNPTPTSCPDYTDLPVVDYRWPSGYHVTGYFPFSTEFEVVGSTVSTACYSSDEGQQKIAPGDPTSHVVDTAAGTSYGPQYVSGQNFSYIDASDGWRLVTDPVPITGVTVSPSSGTFTLGTVLELNATVSGGTPPYSALWSVDGTYQTPLGLHYNWTAASGGSFLIAAYGVDSLDLVDGPANATIDVPGVLTVGPISTTTPSNGADVGQSFTIFARVNGGRPPYQYDWVSLPEGCAAANTSELPCVPTAPGTFPVGLTVTDSNGTQVDAPGLTLVVSTAFSATAAVSRSSVDVGQEFWANVTVSGGATPVLYAWSDVPAGCAPPTGPSAVCEPLDPGRATLTVAVTDRNGVEVNLTLGTVTMDADPTVDVSANRVSADAGVTIVLAAVVTGGVGPYDYRWAGLPAGCTPASSGTTASCSFPAGSTSVGVNVTDANDYEATSAWLPLAIAPALTATLTGTSSVVIGGTVSLRVTPSGGSGTIDYTWQNLPAGCSAPTGGDLTCAPSAVGSYNVTVIVLDGGGGRVTVHAPINVSAPSSPASSGGPSVLLVLAIVGVVAVGAIGAFAAVRRRRHS
jgi:hypothetical protein